MVLTLERELQNDLKIIFQTLYSFIGQISPAGILW